MENTGMETIVKRLEELKQLQRDQANTCKILANELAKADENLLKITGAIQEFTLLVTPKKEEKPQ